MQNIKTAIKTSLRKVLPSKVFGSSYVLYQKAFGNPEHSEYIEGMSKFTNAGFYDFSLDDTQFKIFLDPENGCVDANIFLEGSFEPGILRFIKSELTKDDIFYDIGANISQHSLYTSFHCGQVYAFEPILDLYEQSKKSIEINNIKNIEIFNFGLGNENSQVQIYSNKENMGGSSILISENRKKGKKIEIKKLDEVFEVYKIQAPNFVKIDVEGYEHEVLLGAKDLFTKFKPKIIIEFTPLFYNKIDKDLSQKIYNLFLEMGYKIYDIGLDGEKKVEINNFADLDYIKDSQTNLFLS